ncbi:MAG: membrane-bound lytic murein transglycosylase D [Phenylobacterium sp.]|jgi:membrane-bound lytic murein transglycosylase D
MSQHGKILRSHLMSRITNFMRLKPLSLTIKLSFCLFALTGCQSNSDNLSNEQNLTTNQANSSQIAAALVSSPTTPPLPTPASAEEIFEALTNAGLHPDPLAFEEPEVVVFDDIWKRMQSQLSIEVPQNRKVIAQRNWYAKHLSYLDRISNRATPFLYFIVEEIERRNMPIELALLPIVESAFDPFAYSHGRASGMWQFIPGTAKRFGLKQNWWYDGRRDVIASTHSALDYLSFLHKTLEGDWLNAIAAYNSGEGRILRAIKRNKRKHLPTDFWSLDLPKETAAYVPKLLALADLLKRPEEFDLVWKKIENVPQIAVVDAKSQMDIALAAEMVEIPVGELHGLNPGYSQWATSPEGPHTFIVPLAKAEMFKQKLAKTSKKDRLKWQRYQIKQGDSLGKIARKFNTSIDTIQAVNNIKGNKISQGKFLLIPIAAQDLSKYTLSQDQRLATKQKKKTGSYKIDYTVKKGDTFWDISREYKVNVRSLAKWNNMAPKDLIRPGQNLAIWKSNPVSAGAGNRTSTVPVTAAMRSITYKVRKGDSLARIAGKFSIMVRDILKWNQIDKKSYLQPGQKLKLFVDVTKV